MTADAVLAAYTAGERDVGVDLRGGFLDGANLSGADLFGANFFAAHLSAADLSNVDLSHAELGHADLSGATLTNAKLREAELRDANLSGSNLSHADFSGALLYATNLNGAVLSAADFSGASFFSSALGRLDLSVAALAVAQHRGPSSVGIDTLNLTAGGLVTAPSTSRSVEAFLRGCGVSDWEIVLNRLRTPGLSGPEIAEIQNDAFQVRIVTVLQLHNLFISYSHADSAFVDAIELRLNAKHIRFWRDVHDMKAGKMDKQIDRGMRENPTVLLVLSAASVESDWVESEARRARRLEKELGRDCLCLVAIDLAPGEALRRITQRWSQELADQIAKYNVLDFRGWDEGGKLDAQFGNLLDGLALFYEPPKKQES